LYGQALTNIKKENLINKINGKGMLVTVEFEKNNNKYRIERGRKPNILKLFVNDSQIKSDNEEDESQGDSRETQKAIDQMLEMSHTMFKHLVALNTYTEPFLSMRSGDQREIIEQLLGITMLSEKAETLKASLKETKDSIIAETANIEAIKRANDNIQKSIDGLISRSSAWAAKKEQDLSSLVKSIETLSTVDIATEIEKHGQLKIWEENNLLFIDSHYKNSRTPCLTKCNLCFNCWKICLDNVKLGRGCPDCSKRKTGLKNNQQRMVV
jgi:hypothetical protein